MRILLIAFVFSVFSPFWGQARAGSPSCDWERDPGHPYEDLHFPDTYVSYWRYRVKLPAESQIKLRIQGTFPHTRYMSLAAYDQRDRNQTGALDDENIQPQEGNQNPFQSGVRRDVEKRSYTAWAIPEGIPSQDPNILRLPSTRDRDAVIDIWYRVYLPDPYQDILGGVDLPEITAWDSRGGRRLECPERHSLRSLPVARSGLPPSNRAQNIDFYATIAENDYGNGANRYAVAKVDFGPDRDVALVTFKAPTFPGTFTDVSNPLPSGRNVRYWSLCLAGMSGEVTSCLADTDTVVEREGRVQVLVGPAALASQARERGLNFIPRGKQFVPLLIYRNLLPKQFAMALQGPFAPRGRYYSVHDFLEMPRNPIPLGKGATLNHVHYLSRLTLPTTPTVRLGVSTSFFLGRLWQQNVIKRIPDLDGTAQLISTLGNRLDEILFEKTGLHGALTIATPDVLSRKLDEGSLDFILVVGNEFPWIEKVYPDLEPLLFGRRSESSSIALKSHLVVRKEWMTGRGIAPGQGNIEALRGLRLSVGPLDSSAMFALYKEILDLGMAPEGFFKTPQVVSDSFAGGRPGTVGVMISGLVGHWNESQGAAVPNADVALVTDWAWEAYGMVLSGVRAKLEIFKTLTPAPGPMVLYHPRKVQRSLEETLENFMVKQLKKKPDRFNMMDSLLLTVFGVDQIRLISQEFSLELENHKRTMARYPEFFLPVQFMDPPASWRLLR